MAIAGKKLSVFEGRMKSVITINVSAGHGGSIKPSAGVAIGYGDDLGNGIQVDQQS